MTINVHSLLHLPNTVKNLGTLWAHSCFPFEAANGELLKLFHGSQSVEKQVGVHIVQEIHACTSTQEIHVHVYMNRYMYMYMQWCPGIA